MMNAFVFFFFFQAEDGIRDLYVTGVQTCALPICPGARIKERRAGEVRAEALDQRQAHPLHLARIQRSECAPHCHRSEEHTSELQSRRDLVCRLLLEKKKLETYVVQLTKSSRARVP